MTHLARLSFSYFRNKIWVGLYKRAGITRLAYSFDTSRLGHGDWGTLTATFNGTYIDRVVLQAVVGGPEQSVVGKFDGGFLGPGNDGGSFTHNRWYTSLFYDGPAGSPLAGLDTGFIVHYIGQYWDGLRSTIKTARFTVKSGNGLPLTGS